MDRQTTNITDYVTQRQFTRPHVVIIGGGFGGIKAARTLRNAPVDVTLIDRNNHHVFQPLLYQVATAVGFRDRFLVLFQWAWAYLTFQRGARLIVQDVVRTTLPIAQTASATPEKELSST